MSFINNVSSSNKVVIKSLTSYVIDNYDIVLVILGSILNLWKSLSLHTWLGQVMCSFFQRLIDYINYINRLAYSLIKFYLILFVPID